MLYIYIYISIYHSLPLIHNFFFQIFHIDVKNAQFFGHHFGQDMTEILALEARQEKQIQQAGGFFLEKQSYNLLLVTVIYV